MIVVAEIASNEWEHEKSNRRMLKLISECSEDTIYFAASYNHIQVVNRLGIPESVICHEIDVIDRDCIWLWDYKAYYAEIIKKILQHFCLSKDDKLFILTVTGVVVSAAVEANAEFKTQIYFLEHSNLESILCDIQEGRESSEAKVFNQAAELDNVHFLVYNPFVKSRLNNILTPKAIDKISFLHLPVFDEPILAKKEDCLTIGVYGACFNSTFRKFLKMLYKKNGMGGQLFLVLRRCDINHMDYRYMVPAKGVEMHQAVGGFSRENLIKYMERMDWILMPYLDNQFQVSMSGVLSDALEYEKPILALNSPIIKWYNQPPIGIVKDSLEELCDEIIQQTNMRDMQKYELYKANMRYIKVKGEQENRIVMKKLLK